MSVRGIVTGHDEHGRAIIQEEGPPARVVRIGGEIGPMFHEVWNTRETPARIDRRSGEPAEEGIQLAPPRNGTRIRVLDIPPEDERLAAMSAQEAKAHFAEVGAGEFVGEGAIVSRAFRSAQVITKTSLTALAITAEEGRRLAAEIPALGALIQKEAADRANTD